PTRPVPPRPETAPAAGVEALLARASSPVTEAERHRPSPFATKTVFEGGGVAPWTLQPRLPALAVLSGAKGLQVADSASRAARSPDPPSRSTAGRPPTSTIRLGLGPRDSETPGICTRRSARRRRPP